ncbi:PAS domain-containing protein [Marinibaculum pumilum]|uniref:histidine kinase n=1 Tax=Marinibaculum pumilum TaxID=1766165 RepID=A0ABV7KYQ4_9PROT
MIQTDDIAFDILFEAAPNPYVLMDASFRLVWMNQAYLQVTMRTRDELVGRNMFEAFPSDPASESHRQLRTSLERVVQTRSADQIPLIHYAIPRPDGGFDERFWSATHTPLLGDDGAVRLILQHTVDVTELQVLRGLAARAPRHSAVTTQVEGSVLRHAQRIEETSRALAQERDQLRQLFQQAPSFMAVLEGPEHVYTLANDSYARLVGPRQLLGRSVAEVLPEVERQGFVRLLDQVYATGRPYVGQAERILLEDPGGGPPQEHFLDFVYQPIRDGAGQISGIFVQGHDLTRQKQAEAARRAETRALEVLNRTGAEVAAELDLDRLVTKITDAGVELSGARYGAFFYNVEAEIGAAYTLYALSGAPAEAFEGFPMPRATELFGPTYRGEEVVRCADVLVDPRYGRSGPHHGLPAGHLPVRSYLAVPVKSRSGDVIGGLFFGHPEPGMFSDRSERLVLGLAAQAAVAIDNARLFQAAERQIAQRREAENALQALNATLEEQVAARTAELRESEEALHHAQKMEAVGKLTGGIAHDFNNLLQVIAGNLQLLSKDVAGREKAEERLQNALAGVARGSKLAAQLLAFGRRQPLAPKVINAGRLIARLDDMLRRALGEGVELETVLAGGLWNTLADPTQVENALLNLAINARDAMDGHGRLTLEAGNAYLDEGYASRHDVTPGQYVMLAVTDTGRGMAAEVLDQAFEPFFTTKPEGQGTGLGLSQVYGFVRQSDGHVKIYSEPGEGTTVRIYLPRSDQAEDAPAPRDRGPVTGGSETILVVEDDENVRTTVVDMLSDLGYRVLMAKDAQSALIVIESGAAIDLLFTDVVMPGPLRSTELARKAKALLPGIAVLFTSGYTENAIVHGGRLDRDVELLSKPYAREDLAHKIREVLRRNSGTADAHSVGRQPVEVRAAEGRVDGADIPAAPAAGLRILLVEDDAMIRWSTADMLADLGHQVVEAGDAGAALAALDSDGPVDLLFADVGLPDRPGGELAVEVRRRHPRTGIVFATGRDEMPAEVADMPAPAPVLLVKPYDERRLSAALLAALPD